MSCFHVCAFGGMYKMDDRNNNTTTKEECFFLGLFVGEESYVFTLQVDVS